MGAAIPEGKEQSLGVVCPIEKHWEPLQRCTQNGWIDRDAVWGWLVWTQGNMC